MSIEKNKVLILSSYCFDHQTANGICALNIYHAFKDIGADVYLMGYTNEKDSNDLCRVYCERKHEETSRLKQTIHSLIRPIVDNGLIREYYTKAKTIIIEKHITLVVCMFLPFETIEVGLMLKQEITSLKLVLYELDSSCDISHKVGFVGKMQINAIFRWHKRCYSVADRIVIMRCHEKYVRKTLFRSFPNKILFSDLPMLEKRVRDQTDSTSHEVFALYAGTLSSRYRSPNYCLSLLNYGDIRRINVHFFSSGDCQNLIDSYVNGQTIFSHGIIDHDELIQWERKASFLINIANKNSNSLPSKLINYISTGKPIIHFTNSPNDVCISYLKKYPACLIINEEDPLETSYKKLMKFIDNNQYERVDYDHIAESYAENLPEYSVNLINNL